MTTMSILHLLEQCSSMRHLKQIHSHVITMALSRFTFISSKLLAFYALSPHGNLRYAHAIFTSIPFPTVFHYNTIIIALPHRASSLFLQMLSHAVQPNSRTFALLPKASPSLSFIQQLHSHILTLGHVADLYVITSLITAYSNHNQIAFARRVFDESPHKNVACWTSLVTAYSNCGLVDRARELFQSIPDQNDVSYSAMVSGYVNNGRFREAIELFRDLKNVVRVKPNNSLLASVLSACAAVGAFEQGKWVHSYAEENGLDNELHLETALIDFYTKCGTVQPAERVFGKMKVKDVAAWSAMIMGFAMNARNRDALQLFAKMEKVGPRPNAVTFIAVLTACNHKHLWGKATRLFRYMRESYGIVASIEHYGCVVDVLARSGKIEDALAFIKNMAVEPDGVIWGSLLNGCFLHGYVELGHRVGKYLIEFEPGHSGRYVLLANMYASMGKWEGVFQMRKLMKERGVPVVSAWSFIEIDQTVHKFVVNDRCSLYSTEVYRVLNYLGRKLEDYSSKTNDSFLIVKLKG